MAKENILLCGGAGFIGSRIARKLVETNNCNVFVFDAFIQYTLPYEYNYFDSLQYRFEGILDKITIIRGDARHFGDISRALALADPDRIIHLAAMPISGASDVHIEEAVQSTVMTTTNILELIRNNKKIKRFTYTSSSMVYGDFQYVPADENHPRDPHCVYGGAKLAGEALTTSICQRFSIPYTIIRPSAVYGPTDINRRVSQIFIDHARHGKTLRLQGAHNTLDFTYVDDTAQGFILGTFKEEGINQVFNITRGEGRTLLEYAEILKKYYPEIALESTEKDPHMPIRGALDITKAKTLLGYSPRYKLEDGIEAYLISLNAKKEGPADEAHRFGSP